MMREVELLRAKGVSLLRRGAVAGAWALLLAGCSLNDLVGTAEVPSHLRDPAATETPAGALAAYHGVLGRFRSAFSVDESSLGFVEASGVLSDELVAMRTLYEIDLRLLPEGEHDGNYAQTYAALHKVRGEADQALGLLRDFPPDAATALRGHLFALKGYSEVMLAELFCSGIPLSTVDYKGDYTLRPGSTTAEVLEHALTLFDSALALAGDSARIVNLVRMGQGRALLGLGKVDLAAQAVAAVPDDFHYTLSYSDAGATKVINFASLHPNSGWRYSVADEEGGNGLPYLSSGDPRTSAVLLPPRGAGGLSPYHPTKYDTLGTSSMTLASGVEARLIEAEAALEGGGAGWLATLDALRTTGSYSGIDQVVVRVDTTFPGGVQRVDTTFHDDTLWVAGTGGIAGLGPLEDPGTVEGRIDLVFRERAFWLFLTGHRQGDMRRLVRHYGRAAETVYPVGIYRSGYESYGSDVTAPIPMAERASNPHFTGCISRGA